MKQLSLTLVAVLLTLFSFSQKKGNGAVYPINPDTKLISINKVIVFPDSTLSTTSIKSYIKQFFELNQNGGTMNVDRLSKKNRDKMPSFSAGISLDQDSLIVYDCDMELNYVHQAVGQSLIHQEGGDHFAFKIKLFIKTGKFRYEFTNMAHAYIYAGIYRGLSGGKFENDKPEKAGSVLWSDKSQWDSLKKDAFQLISNIARDFEKAMLSNDRTNQFNF